MKPYYEKDGIVIYHGDSLATLRTLPDGSVNCCVTSPPYWGLRDYGVDGQMGLEETPEGYVAGMVELFREVRRVLTDDGTLWLNLGDSYTGGGGFYPNAPSNLAGSVSAMGNKNGPRNIKGGIKPQGDLKPKDLVGIPWRVAFALQADGWWLRQDIIWHKPNPMPESVTDRCTKSHEYIFLLSKSQRYYFDSDAIAEVAKWQESWSASDKQTAVGQGGRHGETSIFHKKWENTSGKRNRRSVWSVPTCPFPGAHFAVFPPKLIEPCIMAGCPEGGIVLDPFNGSGTTCWQARELGRRAIGCELNSEYCDLAINRLAQGVLF